MVEHNSGIVGKSVLIIMLREYCGRSSRKELVCTNTIIMLQWMPCLLSFSERNVVKVDTLSKRFSILVYIFSSDRVGAINFFFGFFKSNVGLPSVSCLNFKLTTVISFRTHSFDFVNWKEGKIFFACNRLPIFCQ